ncbi:putative methylated DNA-protein cysteine methyltransferase [Rubidibacter lacunae KORDI 51-2]|uniref:Putative methylated DNA-protein cysteine methyltransferase n=1 Tax=Rubidibacter lacunae KORDI 51-2 TaxID=582515 RepID=U5DAT6_9CHRO|nr:MGMT family protein [Rubidibacter lacunae]ERN41658.1 putative methylated DNA-protein cysteine methyltransferase [Rubidibacter lacunae KORDI 51-2]
MTAYERIYAVTRQIPRGRVATYGQVAELSGLPGQARLVGYALYRVVDPIGGDIPWQRVVNAKGKISYATRREGSDDLQRSLLVAEGIDFSPDDRIDLKRYRWQPTAPVALPDGDPSDASCG